MTPPPAADQLASRIFLGPALRAQSDKRLVTLVREGYEAAFEEIVRRYRRPLDRFAATIVGGRSEDVTQDAFSKALLALRGSKAEIELRPWLYRIVRNTALNDLRDRPPTAEQLEESIPAGLSAAEAAERREEMAELMSRLRALPEPQRAAIVMRELEGLSHDEIAAALGVSGGAARQAIFRAREALRNGLGALIPLPLLRLLAEHGTEVAAGSGAAAAAGAAGASAAGSGAALGGLSAGGAIKAGVATALIAGSVGVGAVAIEQDHGGGPTPAAASSSSSTPSGAHPGGSGQPNRSPVALADDEGLEGGAGRDDGGTRRSSNRGGRDGSGDQGSSGQRQQKRGEDDGRQEGREPRDDREQRQRGRREEGRTGDDGGSRGGHGGGLEGDDDQKGPQSGPGGEHGGSGGGESEGAELPPPPSSEPPPPEESGESESSGSGSSGSGSGEDGGDS